REDGAFTAGYPQALARGHWHPLWLFVHLTELEDEVKRTIRQQAQERALNPSTGTVPANARLRRGARLRVVPHLPGLDCDPAAVDLHWLDNVQQVAFRVRPRADSPAGQLLGSIDVYSGELPVGIVPLALTVTELPAPAPGPATTSAHMVRSVFASYAHRDGAIVNALV